MDEKLYRERERLQEWISEALHGNPVISDDEIRTYIEDEIVKRSHEVFLTLEEKQLLKKEIFNAIRGLDILSDLIEDDEISEIMINGNEHIFIERRGKVEEVTQRFSSEERLRNVIQQIVSRCNRIVNETSPIVDARLEDGSRVNVVLPPISLNGPIMTIRKFPKNVFTLERLIEIGTLSKECGAFLSCLVKAKYNIFISGGTGSGKTTFLNALSNCIPEDERVITIEDSAELQIQNIHNLVRLETRNANVEGENEIPMTALIKTALRMRPDRIIVGEVRDCAAMDMANSMLTGHDGSLSTGHGNSAREMMLRLETMVLMGYDMPVLAIRQQLVAAIDIVIHLGRLRDKSRHVLEICEIVGIENGEIVMNPLYRFCEVGDGVGRVAGELRKVNELKNREKLLQNGYE